MGCSNFCKHWTQIIVISKMIKPKFGFKVKASERLLEPGLLHTTLATACQDLAAYDQFADDAASFASSLNSFDSMATNFVRADSDWV